MLQFILKSSSSPPGQLTCFRKYANHNRNLERSFRGRVPRTRDCRALYNSIADLIRTNDCLPIMTSDLVIGSTVLHFWEWFRGVNDRGLGRRRRRRGRHWKGMQGFLNYDSCSAPFPCSSQPTTRQRPPDATTISFLSDKNMQIVKVILEFSPIPHENHVRTFGSLLGRWSSGEDAPTRFIIIN